MATVEQRIRDYIASSSDAAFLTSEFMRFGSKSVVAHNPKKRPLPLGSLWEIDTVWSGSFLSVGLPYNKDIKGIFLMI